MSTVYSKEVWIFVFSNPAREEAGHIRLRNLLNTTQPGSDGLRAICTDMTNNTIFYKEEKKNMNKMQSERAKYNSYFCKKQMCVGVCTCVGERKIIFQWIEAIILQSGV